MSDRDDPEPGEPAEGATKSAEPEPDWAAEIRRLRRAHGDRLRSLFASFEDDERQEEP